MEKKEFEAVLATIKGAALVCAEEGDFLSFVTILGHHLEDWSVYSSDQRLELLELVIATLEADTELLEEIGWDMPAMVFPFVDQDWPLNFSLQKQPFIKVFWRFCDLLARNGQPKELLLSCCEMLATMEDPEDLAEENVPENLKGNDRIAFLERPLKCFSLKFHALIQIINSCLQRNETLYPSKFLSKVVVSIVNFYKSAPNMSHNNIVIRRVHGFIRDYIPPNVPSDLDADVTEEELLKLQDDEAYLQRKLLIFLLTLTTENMFKAHPWFMLAEMCPHFFQQSIQPSDSTVDLFNRLYSLAVSLDLDIAILLYQEIKSLGAAFDTKPVKEMKTSEDVFKHVISIYNSTYFREKLPSTFPISPSTLLCLYMHGKYVAKDTMTMPGQLDVLEIIKFQLAMFLPYTIDNKLSNISAVTCSMLWLMCTAKSDISLSHAVLSKPENWVLINTSLQTVAGVLISGNYLPAFRKLLVLYMGRMLKTLPEEESWGFIVDTLTECPYESFVIDSLNILKELVKKDKYEVEDLTRCLDGMSIETKEKSTNESAATLTSVSNAPPPPPREPQKFITLDESKQNAILVLFDAEIKEVFPSSDSFHPAKANKLLSYINFVNSVSFDAFAVKKRVEVIMTHINNQPDGASNTVVGLLEFALANTRTIYNL